MISLTAIAVLIAAARAGSPSIFPCPGDKKVLAATECRHVALPANLCTACPLNPPLASGEFADCHNIYGKEDICLAAMNEYVANNPCDDKRKQTMVRINAKRANWQDWAFLDYFLYSVCEQCCDCIPMGTSSSQVGQLLTTRGNCPAHAVFDICAILPKVTHFTKIGETKPEFNNAPEACPHLNAWRDSPKFNGWLTNPKTENVDSVDRFLQSLLDAAGCSTPNIWNHCFDLESKQKNLGTPGTFKGTGTQNNAGNNDSAQNENNTSNTASNNDSSQNHNGNETSHTSNQDESSKDTSDSSNSGNSESAGTKDTESSNESNDSGVESEATPAPSDTCEGEIRWGCLDWNSALGKCLDHGLKCFPSPSPLPTCKGEFKWGCLDWNSQEKKCEKHGQRCFP